MSDHAQSHLLSAEDMVIPLYNALLTLEAYLASISSVSLPSQIATDPAYQELVEQFTSWQGQIWNQFYSSLLNEQILAQAQEVNNFFLADKTAPVPDDLLQKECQSAIFETGQPVSIVQRACVQFSNLVGEGTGFVTQLDNIVATFTAADAAKVKAALEQVNTLNQQFQSQEQDLNKDMLGADTTVLTTIAKVSVDLGLIVVGDEDADPLKPLKEGVIQIGKDVGKAIVIDTQVGATLTALESAIQQLDEDEYQLFQILIVRQQLGGITSQTEPALKALSRIEIEWGRVADTVGASLHDWKKTGMTQIGNWASLMLLLGFQEPSTQTISYNGSVWSASPV